MTATQNTDVTQDTAPVTEPAAGVVAVFAMVLQFDAPTCAGTVRPCGVAAWAPPEPRSASAMSAAARRP